MKEICLLNNNEKSEDIKFNENFGNYKTLKEGNDDIVIITNYPYKTIYTIKENDSVKSLLAKGFACDENQLNKGDVVLLKSVYNSQHIVSPLENLTSICLHYGVNENDIKQKNNLKTNRLFIGQILDL